MNVILFRTIRTFLIALMICNFSQSGIAQEKRSMLSGPYPASVVRNVLVAQSEWRPFPRAEERAGWVSLPQKVRNDIVRRGEQYLNFKWPSLPATVFLEFERTGNRSNYQNLCKKRRTALASLVLAECMEGRGRFLDDIVNGIWAICEETYWGVPAHLNIQRRGHGLPDANEPTVDLFASETGSLLAWTHYLLGSQLGKISPLVPERIESEIQRRILVPCLERDDFWWMGFRPNQVINNWNPWVNSNWLTCTLLIEEDESRRNQAVAKILRSLDVFIDSYPEDGGCDEGPGYWNRAGASLFDCLELLYTGSNGAVDVFNEPLIKAIGRYILYAHIFENYFINFADAAAIVNLKADLTYRYGRRIQDNQLAAFGSYQADLQRKQGRGISGSIGRQLPAIFNYQELVEAPKNPPLFRDVWMAGNQVMAARFEAGSAEGLYVAAKGGHNQESHNHNDIGNFIVYLDGQPMIIDVGVETYTRKTFSDRRYEIWTMQSAYHNLPTINGVMQIDGRSFAAKDVNYTTNDNFAQLKLDIAGAYPEKAGLKSWVRTIRLNRNENVEIRDDFELNQPSQDIVFNFMTVCTVEIDPAGKIFLQRMDAKNAGNAHRLNLIFDADKFSASSEAIALRDNRLKSIWGDTIYRIQLKTKNAAQSIAATFIFEE